MHVNPAVWARWFPRGPARTGGQALLPSCRPENLPTPPPQQQPPPPPQVIQQPQQQQPPRPPPLPGACNFVIAITQHQGGRGELTFEVEDTIQVGGPSVDGEP